MNDKILAAYDKLMDLIDKYDNALHPVVLRHAKKCTALRDKERRKAARTKRHAQVKKKQ